MRDAAGGALQGQAAKATEGEAGGIDADKALDIAMADAGVSKDDVNDVKSQLDYDEDLSREVFEVEFKVGFTEYNYDIDPDTGAILFSESEVDDD